MAKADFVRAIAFGMAKAQWENDGCETFAEREISDGRLDRGEWEQYKREKGFELLRALVRPKSPGIDVVRDNFLPRKWRG